MSRMSATTAARSSRSKWDSARCFVTVLAMPLLCRPWWSGGWWVGREGWRREGLEHEYTRPDACMYAPRTAWPAGYRASAPAGARCRAGRTATRATRGPRCRTLITGQIHVMPWADDASMAVSRSVYSRECVRASVRTWPPPDRPRLEAVVDHVLQVLAHPNLSHANTSMSTLDIYTQAFPPHMHVCARRPVA
jgi:hypothetical protein